MKILIILIIIIIFIISIFNYISYKKELFQNKQPFPIDIVIPTAGENNSLSRADRDEGILNIL